MRGNLNNESIKKLKSNFLGTARQNPVLSRLSHSYVRKPDQATISIKWTLIFARVCIKSALRKQANDVAVSFQASVLEFWTRIEYASTISPSFKYDMTRISYPMCLRLISKLNSDFCSLFPYRSILIRVGLRNLAWFDPGWDVLIRECDHKAHISWCLGCTTHAFDTPPRTVTNEMVRREAVVYGQTHVALSSHTRCEAQIEHDECVQGIPCQSFFSDSCRYGRNK